MKKVIAIIILGIIVLSTTACSKKTCPAYSQSMDNTTSQIA